ncbi:MAG: ATP synthase F0 subunit C [Lachnospiraceae bacterium]|nr:ATP synthase F0 subunit C [Lachnospiraceae bacterium]
MKTKTIKKITKVITMLMLIMVLGIIVAPNKVYAADVVSEEEAAADESSVIGDKALAAGLAIGLAAGAGAIGMGWAIAKSAEGVSRQPEAESKIRTMLMLGLVFVETAIIYALIVAILIIFVL